MNDQIRKVSDVSGDLHVDSYLTSYSEAYQQDAEHFVAGRGASAIPVTKESNKYAIYPRGYFWRDEVQVRPLGGRPPQAAYKVESGTYLCEEWALEHTIDDRQRANADSPIRLDEKGTELLSGKQMIRADRIWAENFMQTGVWSNEATGATDFTAFNDAAATPVTTMDEYRDIMLQSTGFMPNTIVMGNSVLTGLRSNPDILDRIKYTQRGQITREILASLFEVDQILVARSVYNAATEGSETDDFQFICNPNDMLLCYIDPNPGYDSPTAIARFNWTGLIAGGGANDMGGVIERGRDERAHSDWFQSRQAFDMKVIAADLGIYFNSATIPVS